MNIEPKYIIAMSGDKSNFFRIKENYKTFIDIVKGLSLEKEENVVHKYFIGIEGESIVDIITESEEYAEKLKSLLSETGIFKKIEVMDNSAYPIYPFERYKDIDRDFVMHPSMQ